MLRIPFDKSLTQRKWLAFAAIAVAPTLAIWQLSIALADTPQPNPLASAPGIDVTAPGPAATIHGDPAKGEVLFAQNCSGCHAPLGTGGVANPGSDDGTVPPLDPIDPGFVKNSNGDPAIFAHGIDLFVQHGSRPAGDSPKLSMTAFGDNKVLTQNQLADIEAYVMQLNGVYWPDRWNPPAEVQVQATRDGDNVTYKITVVNHGVGLANVDLKDTLPAGLTYVNSYEGGPGANQAKLTGNTVEWLTTAVPQAGRVGPYVIMAKATGPTVPADAAQAQFDWTTWNGTLLQSSAMSAAVVPDQGTQPVASAPAPAPVPEPAVPAAPAPVAPAPAAPAQPAPVTQAPAPVVNVPAGDPDAGKQAISKYACGACHTIPGVQGANGAIAASLAGFGSQPQIASAVPNTIDNLVKWLQNPQSVKQGTTMPSLGVTDADATNIATYLSTLK